MPFNGSGSFSIVNTFVPNTTILSSPMNANFSDIATGLSDCLTRDNQAGMTAILRVISGTVSGPGLAFTSDVTSGLYLVGAGNPAVSAAGVQAQNWSNIAAFLPIGIVESGAISPTILSANQNNYAPTNIDTTSCLLLTSNANVTITGMAGLAAGTAPVSGRMMKIFNDNTLGGNTIILSNADTNSIAANRFSFGGSLTLNPQQGCELRYSGADSRWLLVSSFNFVGQTFQPPQFRLTLSTGTPVISSNVTAQTTIYYTPYNGGYVYTWDGSIWTGSAQAEVSQTLADATKSPAASVADSNYDMFYWLDSGTFRCTRGPAWTSATARGTGAGTSELNQVNGVWMNKNSITNGPPANRGIYVGTIRTGTGAASGINSVYYQPVTVNASGGGANVLGVWNMFNRVEVSAVSQDSTNSWNYSTKTWRSADNNNSNRVTFIVGMNEDTMEAYYSGIASSTASVGNSGAYSGIGLNSTSTLSGTAGIWVTAVALAGGTGLFKGQPGLGLGYIQALEAAVAGGGVNTFYGSNAASGFEQMQLAVKYRM